MFLQSDAVVMVNFLYFLFKLYVQLPIMISGMKFTGSLLQGNQSKGFFNAVQRI